MYRDYVYVSEVFNRIKNVENAEDAFQFFCKLSEEIEESPGAFENVTVQDYISAMAEAVLREDGSEKMSVKEIQRLCRFAFNSLFYE